MPPRVLLVDDDRTVRLLVGRMLRSVLGYEVVEAANGRAALTTLGQDRNGFALVLMDLHMPELDGVDTLREVRASERWATLPVVIMSADQTDQRLADGVALGLDQVLPKPFTAAVLASCLASLSARPAARRPA